MAHVHPPPPATTSADLLARDAAHLIHPLHDGSLHRNARVWVRGAGAVLTDADGREYIDGLAYEVFSLLGEKMSSNPKI